MSLVFTTNPQDAEYGLNAIADPLTAVAEADLGYVDYIWEYSSDGSSFQPLYSGLFDITDGTNAILDDTGAIIEGYDTYFNGNTYTPATSTLGVLYYRCKARKTAARGSEETAYSQVAAVTIIQTTVPVILSVSFSKNPCQVGEAILITAQVTEE